MRRLLIGQRDRAAACGFPFRLPLDQQGNAPAQKVNFPRLPGHYIGQILDRPRQVRQRLFHLVQPVCHGPLPRQAALAAPSLIRYTPDRKR